MTEQGSSKAVSAQADLNWTEWSAQCGAPRRQLALQTCNATAAFICKSTENTSGCASCIVFQDRSRKAGGRPRADRRAIGFPQSPQIIQCTRAPPPPCLRRRGARPPWAGFPTGDAFIGQESLHDCVTLFQIGFLAILLSLTASVRTGNASLRFVPFKTS